MRALKAKTVVHRGVAQNWAQWQAANLRLHVQAGQVAAIEE